MNNKIFTRNQQDQEDYEAMMRELILLRKAIHYKWEEQQAKLVDEWLKEEELN